jgi:uncharacterized protein (UPF0332 family)
MKDKDILDLLTKAKESVEASESLLKDAFYDFSFSKHKAVIAAFGKEFVKSGPLPAILHAYLVETFDSRQLGDYGPTGSIDKEKAERSIKPAREFLMFVEEYLRKEGHGL